MSLSVVRRHYSSHAISKLGVGGVCMRPNVILLQVFLNRNACIYFINDNVRCTYLEVLHNDSLSLKVLAVAYTGRLSPALFLACTDTLYCS